MAVFPGIKGSVVSWAGDDNTALISGSSEPSSFTLVMRAPGLVTTPLGGGEAVENIAGLSDWEGTIVTRYEPAQTGNTGSVTWASGYTSNITAYTLNLTTNPAPTTLLNPTNNSAESIALPYSWTATVEHAFDDTAVLSGLGINPPAAITFLHATGNTFSGNAVVDSQTTVIDPTDAARLTQTFVGSGSLTAAGLENWFPAGEVSRPTLGELVLQAITSRTFTGDAYWKALSIVCDPRAVLTNNISFQGSGQLTVA